MTYEVIMTDAGFQSYEKAREYFVELTKWAHEHCPSFIGVEIQDVSDVSYVWDELASYKFGDENDMFWFKTAWYTGK